MAKVYYDSDSDVALIRSKKVAVFGYGSQGHAHALNLRDSGVEVRIGLAENSRSGRKAQADGFRVSSVAEAAAWGDVLGVLVPDTVQPSLYRSEIAPHLARGKSLLFAHGFNIHFNTVKPPSEVDVVMVAPKGPGHRVREVFVEGGGTPALFAVHQDASGSAKQLTLSYARALGSTRAGAIETTFAEETVTDLFGEQAVLCGGVSALIKAAFETLVNAGYQPEVAYFECLHELKLIVDLMYRGGLNYMRYSVSDTAEHGDYTGGPQVVTEHTRAAMRRMLADIQSGEYARRWIEEDAKGRPWFNATRQSERQHLIEQVGARLRAMMPFANPVSITAAEGVQPVVAEPKAVTAKVPA